MSRGVNTAARASMARAAWTALGESGRTFTRAAPSRLVELREQLELIAERLELFVGARLGGLLAEEGSDRRAEARIVPRGGELAEQLLAREPRAGADGGGGLAEGADLR